VTNPTHTLLPFEFSFKPNEKQCDPKFCQKYQQLVGSLMYLMIGSRPNIGFAVVKLAQQMANLSASKVQWPKLSQLSFCSEFNKENSMEFSLISLLLIHFTTMAMCLLSHGPHVTLVMWYTVTVTICHTNCDICDKVMWYFPTLHLVVVSPIRKEKKYK